MHIFNQFEAVCLLYAAELFKHRAQVICIEMQFLPKKKQPRQVVLLKTSHAQPHKQAS